MRETEYAYAVARIRSHEARLLTRHDLDRLLGAADEESCLRILADRGYPQAETGDQMLAAEMDQAWALLRELAPELSVFDVLLCRNDYHNLKAVIKSVATGADCSRLLLPEGGVAVDRIQKAIAGRAYDLLPLAMRAPAEEALRVLLENGDGQLTDVIIDAAQMQAMIDAGKASGCAFLENYAQLVTASANVKIAVRSAKMGKSAAFMRRAMVDCTPVSVPGLIERAATGGDIAEALADLGWTGAADALKVSMAAFEKWCDDQITEALAGAKTKPFGPEPLAAYLIGKENEIRTVRIILSAKHNGLAESAVRERIRTLY